MSDRPTELLAAIATAQFTPRRTDAPLLVALAATSVNNAQLGQLAVALARLPHDVVAAALTAAVAVLPNDDGRARVAVCELARRLPAAHAPAAIAALALAVRDDAIAVRKAAVRGLSNHDHPAAVAALVARAEDSRLELAEARGLIRALAKVGARGALATLQQRFPDLPIDVAEAIAGRHAVRGDAVAIDIDHVFAAGSLLVECRDGIAPIAARQYEMAGMATEMAAGSPLHLLLTTSASLRAALACRGAVRVGIVIGPAKVQRRPPFDSAMLVAIVRSAYAPLRAVTTGPLRYRVSWPGATALATHQVAVGDATQHPDMVNDPRSASWNLALHGAHWVAWPSGVVDDRFAWRQGDIPAASHPTVAAALAFLAQPTDADRVWDPFCGSGSELVECGLLAPGAALIGTDVAASALAVATRNLAAAGYAARATLTLADACASWPTATVIVTNPPHGGRVRADAVDLHQRFFAHVASQLPTGGRLVWIRHSNAKLATSRLTRTAHFPLTLAGQPMLLERWDAR